MRSVLKDVSISEMMTMRNEQGMSNQEIADALGVSYHTVRRLIGIQPKGIRRERSYTASPPQTFSHSDMGHASSKDEAVCPAALVLSGRSIMLHGEIGRYEIDTYAQLVSIQIPEQGRFSLPMKDIRILHNELAAILRNEDKVQFGAEAW